MIGYEEIVTRSFKINLWLDLELNELVCEGNILLGDFVDHKGQAHL